MTIRSLLEAARLLKRPLSVTVRVPGEDGVLQEEPIRWQDGRSYVISGWITGPPLAAREVWFVNEDDCGRLWPQDYAHWHGDGKWWARTFIADDAPTVMMLIVEAPPTACELFDYALKVTRWRGYKGAIWLGRLPIGCEVIGRQRVIAG